MNMDWISVEERLPAERGFYLVSLDTTPQVAMESEFYADKFHRTGGDFGVISCVTHWMPLPEPPLPRVQKESS
jgi:hypothetical protein